MLWCCKFWKTRTENVLLSKMFVGSYCTVLCDPSKCDAFCCVPKKSIWQQKYMFFWSEWKRSHCEIWVWEDFYTVDTKLNTKQRCIFKLLKQLVCILVVTKLMQSLWKNSNLNAAPQADFNTQRLSIFFIQSEVKLCNLPSCWMCPQFHNFVSAYPVLKRSTPTTF